MARSTSTPPLASSASHHALRRGFRGLISIRHRVPLSTFSCILSVASRYIPTVQFGKLLVEELDDMAAVEDDPRLVQIGRMTAPSVGHSIYPWPPLSILAPLGRCRFQKGFSASAPLPSPTKTTAPLSKSMTSVRSRCPSATAIPSIAMCLKLFELGLGTALRQVVLSTSLIRSQSRSSFRPRRGWSCSVTSPAPLPRRSSCSSVSVRRKTHRPDAPAHTPDIPSVDVQNLHSSPDCRLIA